MKLIELTKGEYKLNNSISAKITSDIIFQYGLTYLLNGDNGTGKSSFLKNILVPQIDKIATNNFLLFHTEQDVALQFYVIKSYYKGLKKSKKIFSTFEYGLQNLKEEFLTFNLYKNKQIVFILDEIDQYVDINEFLKDLPIENTTLILATHNKQKLWTKENFITLNFKKINLELTEITLN